MTMKIRNLFFILLMLAFTPATMAQHSPTSQKKVATSQKKITASKSASRPANSAAAQRPQSTQKKPLTAAQKAQAQRAAARQRTARQQAARAQVEAQYKEVAYTITGRAHGYPEGEWVKLCEPGTKGLQTIDSVKLSGEDFSFEGKTLSIPKMAYIVMGEGATKTLVELFLEKGDINVDITAAKRIDKVSGTPNNNIYSPYRDSINLVYTDLYNCIRETYKPSTSKEDKEAYQLGADSMRRKLITVTYDFASRNLNNWVGLYLFGQYYKHFSLQQDRRLLSLVPKKYATLPIIAEIRKHCK